MSGPPPNNQQYGLPQEEPQRRPSGFNGPTQGYQGGQMNRPQSMSFQHDQQFQNSALTFNGSSQSLTSQGYQGAPEEEQQRRPSGLNGPAQGYQGPQQGGQMNPAQSMDLGRDDKSDHSFLTFDGSSESLVSNGSQIKNRKKTIRHIPLTPEGNLVVDVPVPDRVLANAKYQSGDEFTYTRYTAVTSTADQFPHSGYTLRQQEMQRSTELFIVVTMYLFQIKFLGIMKRMICSASRCLL